MGIVALKDGRYATYGSVYSIEKNQDCYGMPCVYATRAAALRTAAARAIATARASRKWTSSWDKLDAETLVEVINWYRAIVARELGKNVPKPIRVRPAPAPETKAAWADLPLFEGCNNGGQS